MPSKSGIRIIICAKQDVQPGEELCYDYKVRSCWQSMLMGLQHL